MKLEIATTSQSDGALETLFTKLRGVGFNFIGAKTVAPNPIETIHTFTRDTPGTTKDARVIIISAQGWQNDPFDGEWLQEQPDVSSNPPLYHAPLPIVLRVGLAEIPDFLFPAIVLETGRNTTCNVVNVGPSADATLDRLREKLQLETAKDEIILAEAMLVQAEWSIGLLYDLAQAGKSTTENALEAVDPALAPIVRCAISAISKGDVATLEACFEADLTHQLREFRFPGGHTLLHASASFAGASKIFDVLLRWGVGPDARALNGDAAAYAAAWGSQALSLMLLDAGADSTAVSQVGNSPLAVAAWRGYDELVRRCLEARAPAFVTDKDGGHPLIWAAQAGHVEIVSQIVEAHPLEVDVAAGEFGIGSDDPDFSPNDPHATCFARYLRRQKIDYPIADRTALMAACAAGQLEIVRYLLEKGADPNRSDRLGRRALAHAMTANDEVAALLVDLLHVNKADLDARAHDGATALMEAVWADRPVAARALLQAGANPEVRDEDGFTPLHTAASFGRVSLIKTLAEQADKSAPDSKGFKPLHLSIFFADVQLAGIVALLEANVDPNEKAGDGRTALSLLLSSKRDRADQAAIAKALIEAGADPWLADDRGPVASVTAAIDCFDEFCAPAFERRADLPPASPQTALALICASALGRVDLVGDFLECGAALDYRAFNGLTALDAACLCGRDAVVEYLIQRRANPNTPAGLPTPLTCAAEKGSLTIVDFLLNADADPNLPGPDGNAPLFFAVAHRHADVVARLIDSGAFVGMRSTSGITALHTAAKQASTDIARTLVRAGARTDVQDKDGNTPLHFAALTGDTEMAAFLLDNQAPPNAANRKRIRPLHYAASAGTVEIGELLIGKGADLEAIDSDGDTALHFAVAGDKPEFVDWLMHKAADKNVESSSGERPIDLVRSTAVLDVLQRWGSYPHHERHLESERASFLNWAPATHGQERYIRAYWAEIREHLAEKMGRGDMEVTIASIKCAPLGFYNKIYIAAISINEYLTPNQIFIFCSNYKKRLRVLDWTSEPIYRSNEEFGFDISSEEKLQTYVKFFFFFVRGQLGRFNLVDRLDQIDWAAIANDQDKASVADKLIALTSYDDAPKDMRRLSCTCIFKNALFKTDIFVALRPLKIKWPDQNEDSDFTIGQLLLRNEELLLEELPIDIPGPPDTFG